MEPEVGRRPPEASLEPHGEPPGAWIPGRLVSLIALALGVLDLVVVSLVRHGLFAAPDPRITVPWLLAVVAAAVVAIGRGERPISIPVLGVGLAVTALVLGWFLMVAIVLVGTVIVISLLHAVM